MVMAEKASPDVLFVYAFVHFYVHLSTFLCTLRYTSAYTFWFFFCVRKTKKDRAAALPFHNRHRTLAVRTSRLKEFRD